MIDSINLIILTHEYLILFISHLIIFVGSFYVAMHSRIIPTWLTTCIWYIGLSSLFTLITIMIEWFLGPYEAFSYSNLRFFSQYLPILSISITVFLMFINTVCSDITSKKLRKNKFTDSQF